MHGLINMLLYPLTIKQASGSCAGTVLYVIYNEHISTSTCTHLVHAWPVNAMHSASFYLTQITALFPLHLLPRQLIGTKYKWDGSQVMNVDKKLDHGILNSWK